MNPEKAVLGDAVLYGGGSCTRFIAGKRYLVCKNFEGKLAISGEDGRFYLLKDVCDKFSLETDLKCLFR